MGRAASLARPPLPPSTPTALDTGRLGLDKRTILKSITDRLAFRVQRLRVYGLGFRIQGSRQSVHEH